MDTTGPTFGHLNHKNLPLQAVRQVLQEELRALSPLEERASLSSVSAAAASVAVPSISAPVGVGAGLGAGSASNWQAELDALLSHGSKLPYEDVPTAREPIVLQQQHHHLGATTDLGATVLQPGRPAGEVTPLVGRPQRLAQRDTAFGHAQAAAVPAAASAPALCACDQCYTSISSAPAFLRAARYCWTCHTVLCGACYPAHQVAHRSLPHQDESLETFLAAQNDAYCSAHSSPAPALSSQVNVHDAAGKAVTVRHGVRARALRFSGVYSHFC